MSTHGASSGGGGSRSARGVAERARSNTGGAGITVQRLTGADDAMRRLLGRTLTDREVGRLFAVEPGGHVRVLHMQGDDLGYVGSTPGHSYQNGYLGRDGTGNPHLYISNAQVDPGRRGQNVGTRLFAAQAKQLAALHVPTIALQAARNDREGVTGYKFWPRMGFDAQLDDDTRAQLPARLARATTVQDLMRTPTGTKWWDTHGGTNGRGYPYTMTFDTAPGSRSMQVLRARLAKQGIDWASL